MQKHIVGLSVLYPTIKYKEKGILEVILFLNTLIAEHFEENLLLCNNSGYNFTGVETIAFCHH